MRSVITGSPRNVALIYILIGGLWILASDWAVAAVISDPETLTMAQTLKGWFFIAASGTLVYWLVAYGQRNLERSNDRLERAMSQSSVFHRILRHNLRNQCTIILGHVGLLEQTVEEDPHDSLATIEEQAQRLVDMSAKSSLLRDVVVTDGHESTEHDLSVLIDEAVTRVRDMRDQPAIEVTRPSSLSVAGDPRLGEALTEVLENAVEHNDPDEGPVVIRAERNGTEATIEVSDAGPGLPRIEERVIENEIETQLTHSEGLGLWIARTIVEVSDGTFTTADSERGGTTVEMAVPLADVAEE